LDAGHDELIDIAGLATARAVGARRVGCGSWADRGRSGGRRVTLIGLAGAIRSVCGSRRVGLRDVLAGAGLARDRVGRHDGIVRRRFGGKPFRRRPGGACRRRADVVRVQALLLCGIAAGKAPVAVTFVFAAEFVALGRIVAGRGSVTHWSQFGRGKKL
jgi:hypothetical protein